MSHTYRAQRMITRPVRFDWTGLPFYWIRDEPFASHCFNMTHFLLPAGEKWFCRVFQEALPHVTDPALRADVMRFIKQEANHARAHSEVVAYYEQQGIEVAPLIDWIEGWWREKLGPEFFGRPLTSNWARRRWLLYRLSVVAAIEHFTCVLGQWMLDTDGFDKAGAEPRMVDLLRWHGAEEIEHRAVAFSLLRHLGGGSWPARLAAITSAMIISVRHQTKAAAYVFAQDPAFQAGPARARIKHAQAQNLLPGSAFLLKSVGRFLRPGYAPEQEASLDQADAYLRRSPAVKQAGIGG